MCSDEKKVLDTDARSRISVWVMNNMDNPRIAQIGNFSHVKNRNGFTLGDGRTAVSNGVVIDLSNCGLNSGVQASMPPSPMSSMLPTGAPPASYLLPQVGNEMLSIPQTEPMERALGFLSPYFVPHFLLESDPMYNFIRMCKMIEIDDKDFDKIHEGAFIRTFDADNYMLFPHWTPIPTYDHLGVLRMFVLDEGCIFDLKSFKFTDFLPVSQFRFKPDHPGVWFRDPFPESGETIILDTNVPDVVNRTSPANAELIDVKHVAKLDFEIFRSNPTLLVWRPDMDNIQSRNQLAEALHYLSEAKKHDIEASILKYIGTPQEYEILDLHATIRQAWSHGLDIPANLKEKGYSNIPSKQEKNVPRDIPFFWSDGGITLFFGSGDKNLLKRLVAAFCRPSSSSQYAEKVMPNPDRQRTSSAVFPQKKVAILYPENAEHIVFRFIGEMELGIPCINSAIVKMENELQKILYKKGNEIEIVFIIYADEIPDKDLVVILNICEDLHIVTGIFSSVASEKSPSPRDVLNGLTMDYVSQCYLVKTKGDTIITRNTKTRIENIIQFEDDGIVTVSKNDNNKTV